MAGLHRHRRRVRGGRPATPGSGEPQPRSNGAPDAANEPPPDTGDRVEPDTGGEREADRGAERGLRGLVGSGSSQVSLSAAMRARDAARPTDEDLRRAERELTIVRRKWVPREPFRQGSRSERR